jgi:hypothetical protein
MDNEAGAIIIGGGVVKHHIMNANLMRNGCDHAVLINTGQVGWSAVPFHLSLAPLALGIACPSHRRHDSVVPGPGTLGPPFQPSLN